MIYFSSLYFTSIHYHYNLSTKLIPTFWNFYHLIIICMFIFAYTFIIIFTSITNDRVIKNEGYNKVVATFAKAKLLPLAGWHKDIFNIEIGMEFAW